MEAALKLHICVHVMGFYLVLAQFTFEIQQHFEFENALSEMQDDYWVWRSQAYKQKTLRLADGNRTHSIELTLCIEPYLSDQTVTIYVDDIVYSNDGPSDVIYIQINGINIGNYTTIEKWRSGHEWNVFRNSRKIGPNIVLSKGEYLLQIEVETDKWGVELDRIEINAENQDPMGKLFCAARLLQNS